VGWEEAEPGRTSFSVFARQLFKIPHKLEHSEADTLSITSGATSSFSSKFGGDWGPIGFTKKLHPLTIMVR
jgi:hypothetical protein